jgi:hypothetical protein
VGRPSDGCCFGVGCGFGLGCDRRPAEPFGPGRASPWRPLPPALAGARVPAPTVGDTAGRGTDSRRALGTAGDGEAAGTVVHSPPPVAVSIGGPPPTTAAVITASAATDVAPTAATHRCAAIHGVARCRLGRRTWPPPSHSQPERLPSTALVPTPAPAPAPVRVSLPLATRRVTADGASACAMARRWECPRPVSGQAHGALVAGVGWEIAVPRDAMAFQTFPVAHRAPMFPLPTRDALTAGPGQEPEPRPRGCVRV